MAEKKTFVKDYMTKNVISDTSKNPELYYQHATANLILGRIFVRKARISKLF